MRTRHVFRISREAHNAYHNIFIEIIHEGVVGYGEAAPSGYFGEDQKSVVQFLSKAAAVLGDDPFQIEAILDRLGQISPYSRAAATAVDMALHDLVGKLLGIPAFQLFGLDKEKACRTSFTIGIDTIEHIRQKVREVRDFPVLKVKLGTDYDFEILKAVREESQAVLRVDANGAWTPQEAVEKINRFEAFDVEFIEQPVPVDDLEGFEFVKKRTHLPLFADEPVRIAKDIPKLVGRIDGINIKLMKCGGVREALRMIHVARALDMMIMLGCRVESSVAITAAAHLSPSVDYADLDGNLLTTNDPFTGVLLDEGQLILPERPGFGVVRREEMSHEQIV
ncbi:MAG: dipeptide epimerase [Gemmatimonadota bacterium]|nr:MAG: dipeptide epimerase [Gemmatimonadota bacterium]